jgi:ribose transport system permease protein
MHAPAPTPAPRAPVLSRDAIFVIASRAAALILLVLALSYLSPQFFTVQNLTTVLRQASLQFVMAAGLTIVVLARGIDLSVGAVLGLSACLGATLIVSGHLFLGLLAALGVGLAAGAASGILATHVRLPPFIATYGMMWIAHGIGYVFMKGQVIHGFPPALRFISTGWLGPVPMLAVMAGILLAILHILMKRTKFGRAIYAIGGNPTAARLSGMPVDRYLVAAYALSGMLSGFAAIVVIARVNAADPGLGEELLLPAIAAVCLGGTSLFGGRGGIVGTAVGSLILALVVNGMNLLSVSTFWQAGVMGALVIAAVTVDQFGGKRRAIGT